MEYIGADVDINNVVCSIMSASGKKKETFVVPSNPKGMDQLIEKMGNPKKWKILFESGTYSTDLHIHLVKKGVQSVIANAYNLKLISGSRKKTDKRKFKSARI